MNDNYTKDQFKDDVSWIGEVARSYVVREFIEKWEKRVSFDERTK